jgi:hypothetical protein
VVTLALPVLAVIPTMVTAAARRRRTRRRIAAAVAASLIFALGVAAVAWRTQILQAWGR